jgi:hypothetical protein
VGHFSWAIKNPLEEERVCGLEEKGRGVIQSSIKAAKPLPLAEPEAVDLDSSNFGFHDSLILSDLRSAATKSMNTILQSLLDGRMPSLLGLYLNADRLKAPDLLFWVLNLHISPADQITGFERIVALDAHLL